MSDHDMQYENTCPHCRYSVDGCICDDVTAPAAETAKMPETAIELYATSYDSMSKMGDGQVLARSVAFDIRANIIPLVNTYCQQQAATIEQLTERNYVLSGVNGIQHTKLVAANQTIEQLRGEVEQSHESQLLMSKQMMLLKAANDQISARVKVLEAEAKRFRKIGWAQRMGESCGNKLLLMETPLPKEDLHDNGRPMIPLYVQDEAMKEPTK